VKRAVGDVRVNSSQRQPPFTVAFTRRIVATRDTQRFPGGIAAFTTVVPSG
jgi:hypothetical protein